MYIYIYIHVDVRMYVHVCGFMYFYMGTCIPQETVRFPTRLSGMKKHEALIVFMYSIYNVFRVLGVYSAGAVGDANLYVGSRRDVSASDNRTILFASATVGDDFVLLSHGSAVYRQHCNETVLAAHGACTFYILVTADVPSKYVLTADVQSSDIDYLPLERPVAGVLQPKRPKSFVVTDLKPNFDYRVTGLLQTSCVYIYIYVCVHVFVPLMHLFSWMHV